MAKAQKGDLIRIIPHEDNSYIGEYYEVGDIYEVTERVDVEGLNIEVRGKELYVYDYEYEIHRKAGEEDAPKGLYIDYLEKQDAVNPQHYKQGRTEVIDIIEDAVVGADPFEAVCQANVLKYTLRYRHKNGVEDLKKAVWYAEKLIAHITHK